MNKGSRNYEIILYDLLSVQQCINICIQYGFDYAYIKHDKDLREDLTEYKKIHYHLQIYMLNQKTLNAFSNLFNIKQNYIQFIKDKKSAIRYLIHADNNDKHNYNINDIVSNFEIINYFNNLISNENIELTILLEFINQPKTISFIELYKYALDNNIWSTYRRNYTILRDIVNQHNLLFTNH